MPVDKKKPIILLLLFLLYIFLCPLDHTSAWAEEKISQGTVIKVGAYDNYPKIYLDESGKVVGLFPEILEAIAAEAGWKIEYVFGEWVQCLDRLERGQIDIMVDVGYSENRAKRFAFNEESILVNWGIIYTGKNHPVESFLDLQEKRIAVMKGSIHTDGENGIKNLLRQFNVSAKLVEVENYTKVFELLESEEVEAGVVNRIFGSLFADDYDLQSSSILFNPSQLRFAFPKQSAINHQLIAQIDRSLKKLKSQPHSIYHRALNVYLSGQSAKSLHAAEKGKGERPINLTSEEKAWIDAHPEVLLGIDPEFIPFEYVNDNNEYSGIASDYIKILIQRLGVHFKVINGLTWKQAVNKAKNREIDVLPCVGKTTERLKLWKYSRPYVQFQRVIITRSDFPFITSIEDIKPFKVAVQANSSHSGFLAENTDIVPIGYNTLQEGLLAVSQGQADAFLGNVASSTYWIRFLNLTNLRVAVTLQPDNLNLYFAVRKDWPELVSIINKGLLSISDEEKNRIYKKWIAVEYREGIDPKLVWTYLFRTVAVISVILAIILVWNLVLKREINRRRKAEAKLLYNNQLEHFISETSSRFISVQEHELDGHIQTALAGIARFMDVDLAGLFSFSQTENRLTCTHHWMAENLPDAFINCFETDAGKLPWWDQQLRQQETVKVSSLDDLPDDAIKLKAFIGETGIQSFVDISRIYQDKLIGFLRFGTTKASRNWKDEEISQLKLIGQIITSALQRAKTQRELREYAEELQSANTRLKELDQLKSMFIASMSHELRTPLNSIIGFTGIILKGLTGEINDQQQDQLQRVYRSAKHLLSLITDVIDISKIEAGRVEIFPEPFQASEVIEEAIHTIQNQAARKGLEIDKQIFIDVEMFQDKRRFLQTVINFLSNAVKYTEKGKVTLIAQQVEEKLEILVKDTGIGIEQQDFQRLFEPFERLDSHLRIKAGGTGLGLYLTRKIIEEMLHGDISVESEIGVGSTFRLKIPIRQQANSPMKTTYAP